MEGLVSVSHLPHKRKTISDLKQTQEEDTLNWKWNAIITTHLQSRMQYEGQGYEGCSKGQYIWVLDVWVEELAFHPHIDKIDHRLSLPYPSVSYVQRYEGYRSGLSWDMSSNLLTISSLVGFTFNNLNVMQGNLTSDTILIMYWHWNDDNHYI